MINIDWGKDYKREFNCPHCGASHLNIKGKMKNQGRIFHCRTCYKCTSSSITLAPNDPDSKVNWQRDYKGEFTCPYCEQGRMWRCGKEHKDKMSFQCSVCHKYPPFVIFRV